jgi:hypothetical protein
MYIPSDLTLRTPHFVRTVCSYNPYDFQNKCPLFCPTAWPSAVCNGSTLCFPKWVVICGTAVQQFVSDTVPSPPVPSTAMPPPPVPQARPSLFPPAPSLFITLGLVLLINFKILSWTLAGVRHKDRLTDWLTDDQPTVRRNVILTFRQSKGHNILPTNCFYISRMIFTINRQCFTIQHSPVVILVEAYCSLLGTNWIFRLILAEANIGSVAHLASYSVDTRSKAPNIGPVAHLASYSVGTRSKAV